MLNDEEKILARKKHGVRAYSKRDAKRYQQIQLDLDTPMFPKGHKTIVIGAGPAGMFGALRFAEGGSSVLLLERGGAVEDRHYHVQRFLATSQVGSRKQRCIRRGWRQVPSQMERYTLENAMENWDGSFVGWSTSEQIRKF